MPARRLSAYLNENDVRYVTITHSPAFTAQDVAHSAHISGRKIAKTVIVRMNGSLVMAVLPATCKIDLEAFREASGAESMELAGEADFKDAFPGCELGAMPPFGNLWDMPVYVAEELTEDKEIAFNAGTHAELFQLSYDDFDRLVKPIVVPMTHAVA